MRLAHFSLLGLVFLVIATPSSAQTDCGWNPDYNGDNTIGVADLLGLLGVFEEEDSDGDGIFDSQDDCVGVYDECGVCNGSGVDADADGLCDDMDDCIGAYDECGVCNGPGPNIPLIDEVVYATDSVYLEPLDSWYTFEYAVDTVFTYVCPVSGCMDDSSVNYNPSAVVDDGSCCNELTLVMEDSYGDGWNGNVLVITDADSVRFSATFNEGFSSEASVCLEDGCYIVSVELGDFESEVSWQLLLGGEVLLEGGAPFISTAINFGQDCISGCTEPAADNYDDLAVVDDGSCTFPPCIPVSFEGYTYDVVQIGYQCWFKENLRTEVYSNGDAIPGALSDSEWSTTNSGAQAIYENSAPHLDTYGRLYNWYAVDDARGLCPTGWHVPSDGEWTELTDYLGGESVAGLQMKSSSSDTPPWDGSNSSGFSGLPGGFRDSNGNFNPVGYLGFWWSSSPSFSNAWYRFINSSNDFVGRYYDGQRNGFSVRCVRD